MLLFACRGGAGPSRRGAERAGHLGESFVAAGARAVLLAKTPLRYDASLELAEELHAELRTGAAPATALRRVRERILRSTASGAASDGRLTDLHALLVRFFGYGFE